LFLEELKTWICSHFADFTEKDKDNVRKRCGYLEDILCKEGLFDRPNSDDKFTIQKAIVDVRRILKSTIQTIDANLTHVDAGRSMDEIMDSLRLYMDESASLLWYSFREKNSLEGQTESNDKAVKLHKAVLSSAAVKSVLPHRSKLGGPTTVKHIGFSDAGKVELFQDYLLAPGAPPGSKTIVVGKQNGSLIEIGAEDQLSKIFQYDDSGFDKNFRENAIVAQLYLESYAFLMDLGSLYGVLKQAKGAAQTGGTMLLYGAANAHFNALLELTERLTDGMRSRLSKIVEIGETRFEQLIEINWATVSRCPWIANYRELPRILVQIEKNAAELFKVVGKARSEANALTLKDRKDQAEQETQNFLSAAEGLTKTAGKSLNIAYNSYKSLEQSEKANKAAEEATKSLKDRDASEKEKEKKMEEQKQKEYLEKMEAAAKTQSHPDKKKYWITVRTSKLPGSGTDADVYIVLTGQLGRTQKVPLPDEDKTKFELGKEDRFEIEIEGDIGDVTELRLGLAKGAKDLSADWRVKYVDLHDKGQGKKYYFDCEKTLIGGAFGKTEVPFKPTQKPAGQH